MLREKSRYINQVSEEATESRHPGQPSSITSTFPYLILPLNLPTTAEEGWVWLPGAFCDTLDHVPSQNELTGDLLPNTWSWA